LRSSTLVVVSLLAAAWTDPARAQDGAMERWEPGERTTSRVAGEVGEPNGRSSGDGVYGRFDGDLDVALGAGVEADHDDTRGALRLELLYFSMLGVYGGYSDALGAKGATLQRLAAVGVDVRPAFVPRWSKNMEQGPGFFDLTVDSIGLGIGAFWAEPAGRSFGERRGLELAAGFGLPLFGRVNGPWLEARGLLRFADPAQHPSEKAEGVALALLSWHQMVLTRSSGED
jgi:hypothetical protein